METNDTSLWNTKQSEVTVGDSMKIALVGTVVMAVVPIAVMGVVAGVGSLIAKRQERKNRPIYVTVDEMKEARDN